MSDEEKKHFEEIIFKAVRSGKKETSGLVDEIMHKMENGIEAAINKNVNGKIKILDAKVDAYIISDNKWKDEYSPYLEGIANITGGGKILVWLAMAVSSIFGAYLLVKNYFK